MGDWIDFAEIRQRVPLEEVLLGMYALGERLKRSGRKLIGPCPIHCGDGPRAFQADLEKNLWYCHSGCRRGGNVIDFVSLIEKLPTRDAALKLHAAYLGASAPHGTVPPAAGTPTPRAPDPRRVGDEAPEATSTEKASANAPLELRLTLGHDHPYLLKEREVSLETARYFDVGYCARGLLRGMIAFPIRDDLGQLVAYAGRRLKYADVEKHGKYRFPKGFRKELVLYNLDRVKPLASEHGLVVVEGFFSVLNLYQAGIENVVAVMGCALSDAQAELLAKAASEVTLLFDGDDAGRAGAEEARSRLAARVPTRMIRLPDGTAPDALPSKVLRWAVNGAHGLDLADVTFSFRNPKKPS